jgi:hypothetical protein
MQRYDVTCTSPSPSTTANERLHTYRYVSQTRQLYFRWAHVPTDSVRQLTFPYVNSCLQMLNLYAYDVSAILRPRKDVTFYATKRTTFAFTLTHDISHR